MRCSLRLFAVLIGVAPMLMALPGCSASASFGAGGNEAKAPPAPPPPPPPPPAPAASTSVPPPATTPAPATTTTPAPVSDAKPVLKKDRIELPTQIEFETGSAVLTASSAASITQLKTVLDENSRITKLRIEGHTDNSGTPAANEALSGQRALAIKLALVAQGVAASRLLAVGFGQNKPVADNSTEEGRAKNRRTEFRIAELGGKKYLGLDPTGGGKVFE